MSTKATLVNFNVKQQGLEDQLLGIVVRKAPAIEFEIAWRSRGDRIVIAS